MLLESERERERVALNARDKMRIGRKIAKTNSGGLIS